MTLYRGWASIREHVIDADPRTIRRLSAENDFPLRYVGGRPIVDSIEALQWLRRQPVCGHRKKRRG